MWVMTEGQDVKFDIDLMPKSALRSFCRDTLQACRRFYEDPKNRAAFEEWLKEYEKEKVKTDE